MTFGHDNPYFSRFIAACERRPTDVFVELRTELGVERVSYEAFHERLQAAACYLLGCGVRAGDSVLIFGQHGAPLLQAFFGAQLIGAIPAFMPPPTSRQDAAAWESSHRVLCDRLRPAIVLVDAESEGVVSTLANVLVRPLTELEAASPGLFTSHDVARSAVAFLQHSSGTTGLKKGVVVTYEQLERQIDSYSAELGLEDGDTVVSWLPIYHDMGLIAGTLLPFARGLPLTWIHTFSWLARPQLYMDALRERPRSVSWLPNFAFSYMARRCVEPLEPNALGGVKAIVNCSEPCKPADVEAFARRFGPAGLPATAVQVCYAMAENVFAVTQTSPRHPPRTLSVSSEDLIARRLIRPVVDAGAAATFLSCGSAIAGTQVRIVASEGSNVGEIEVAGDSLCSGYFGNPELSAERFVDGWYKTGDYGFLEGNELFVTGRKDDVIIVRGRNLYAHDIEASVTELKLTRPGRCVAFGAPDERGGTQQLVILAEREDPDEDKVVQSIMEAVVALCGVSPSDIALVDHDVLVKTSSGKMSRSENLDRYRRGELRRWGSGR